jgi:hypothetical protein
MPIQFDPRVFILPPYERCPSCGASAFGILSMGGGTRYTRRCKDCWHTADVPLPTIRKKIVYADQFAISNMMKVLNPTVKGHNRTKEDPFWLELYGELDVLARAQLIVCPSSADHSTESMYSPFYPALKSMYDYLAWGVSFQDPDFIHRSQLATAVKAWLRSEVPIFDYDPQHFVHGRLDHWGDRLLVTIRGEYPDYVDDLRRVREEVADGIGRAFERWSASRGARFRDFFDEEWKAYGNRLLLVYKDWVERSLNVALGTEPPSEVSFFPAPAATTFNILARVVEENGIPVEKARPKLVEFFRSEMLGTVPFLRISASMFAVLAMKAAAGQKEPPNRGTATDVNVVASLLPYCDAMFIDNPSASLLTDIPREHRLPFPCRVFSRRSGDEFLAFLRGIRDAMTSEHRDLVRTLYGRDWDKPNLRLFEK